LPSGKIDKWGLIYFLFKLRFKGVEFKVLYRDAYSLVDFIVIILFKRATTVVYQHKLHVNWKYWRLIYYLFKVQSNVINRLAQPGTRSFFPLYPSRLIMKFVKNSKYPRSMVIVSKYEERKRIEDAINICMGKYEIITVIGVVKDMEYYSFLKNTHPAINFYVDLPYEDCLELVSKHENFLLYSDNEPAAVSPLEAVILRLNVFVRSNNGTNDYFICGREIVDSDDFSFSNNNIHDVQYRKYKELLNKYGITYFFKE
jgi:hypothetical protein